MAAFGEPSLVLQEENFEPRLKWTRIGEGGFSKVYKAYCYKHNCDVAAKEVTRGDQLKEIQKLVKLSTHIHVVGIKGVYRDHDRNFIIMEYCSYSLSKLRKILGKTYIPWPRCLHFMQQIMSGVEFLHHNNIIHRDIKPENVMVTDSFVCKIADFGLAKDQASYTNSKTRSGIIEPSGTMVYNSPERWKSPADPAKESDDIYSCAMVFYKMITNDDLFCMETRAPDESVLTDLRLYLVDLRYRHDLRKVARGSPDTVPEIVITVIEGCWHINPTERKTVQHWTELLRDYINKNVTPAQLVTADKTLKLLLEEGKSRTECDDSKSPTSPLRNRTPAKQDTNDRPDSPTDDDLPTEHDQSPSEVDKPSTRELEGAVKHRGHADGSESPTDGHLPTSKPKPLVGLKSQMSNLTVESDDIQVIILSENNDAMACYRLQGLVSYKLHIDQRSRELCFNNDGNIQRIPLSKIKDYKLNRQEKTFKLGVWAGNVKQNQEIKLSVSSSIESLINQLKDIGCFVEKKPDGTNVDHGSSHQKSAMKRPVSCESSNGRSQGQNHLAHSQSYPDNLQNPYFRQFPRVQSPSSAEFPLDHTEEPPYQTGNHRYQPNQPPFQSGNPQWQPQQPPMHLTGHPPYQPVYNQQPSFHPQYQLGQPSSQAPVSYINIGHVENFYQGPQSSSQIHQKPPYPQSQLTDSSREVNDGVELQQISESVATNYGRVAELLDMTQPSKIKLLETNNNYEEASYQLLHAWHLQQGSQATISRLANVLYRARLYDAAKTLK